MSTRTSSAFCRVYRVEHPDDKLGPYRSEHTPDALSGFATLDRPSIELDLGRYYKDRVFEDWCGFASTRALARWFGADFDLLTEHQFHIAIYLCGRADVLHGRRQVTFKLSAAQFVEYRPLQSLNHLLRKD